MVALAMSSSLSYPARPPKKRVKPTVSPILLRAPSALIPPSLESQRPRCLAYEKLKINLFTALPFILLTLLPVALHLSHIHSVPVFYPCLFLQPGPLVGSLLSLPGLQICLPSKDIWELCRRDLPLLNWNWQAPSSILACL